MPEMASLAKAFCTSTPYRAVARWVVLPWALQGIRPSGEALEIGTGSGAMAAQLLSAFPHLRMVATDYDQEMVRRASDTLSPFGDRATIERADATHLPFEDGRFDCVLSFAMLHHVLDWERAVAEAVRVLRGGGRLVGYDLLDALPFRVTHRWERSDTRMMRSGELADVLHHFALTKVHMRPPEGGLVLRFLATKAP
jgi:ubiquinone/menaquinone biosynthesis C-methylase UbiE